jgi:hypothetical protein
MKQRLHIMNHSLTQSFNDFLSAQLNAQQQKAVLQKSGGILVIAVQDRAKQELLLHGLQILF